MGHSASDIWDDDCPICGGLATYSGRWERMVCKNAKCQYGKPPKKRSIYLLLGPSGSGKSTLGRYLESLGVPEIKSHATRPMRSGESQGSPYYFVTKEEFAQIEMIEDTPYDGPNMYGTSKEEVKRVFAISDTAYAILDKHGVYAFKDYFGADEVKVIYVVLPEVELIERLKGRGDSQADIKKRMKHAKDSGELDNYFVADYVVVNRELEESKRQLRMIVGVN